MTTRRSQIIIKSEFQQKLIMSMVLIALITMNVIIMAAQLLDDRFGSDSSLFSFFYVCVAVMEILAVAVVYFVSRDISFRIAGPVYALERTIRLMGEGNLDHSLKLRPKDQFGEVSNELNRVMLDYRQRIHQLKELARQLDEQHSSEHCTALRRELAWFVTESEVS